MRCAHCTKPFVIRVGEPSEEPTEKSIAADEPVPLEGVTDSADISSTAGEIGDKTQPAFVAAETHSSIKLSPELLDAVDKWQTSPTMVDGALQVVLSQADGDAEEGFEAFGRLEALPTSTAPAPSSLPVNASAANASAVTTTTASMAARDHGAPSSSQPAHHPPSGYPPAQIPDPYDLRPRQSRAVKAVGILMLLSITLTLAFGLFVLFRNDWTLDFSNLDRMVEHAFGGTPIAPPRDTLDEQLSLSKPALTRYQFLDGTPALAASGVVRNLRGETKRYVYVRAELRKGRQIVSRARAPAGNVFTRDEFATLDKESLYSTSNPAGKNGRNTKIPVGASVGYMVVFTAVPPDYSPGKYDVVAHIDSVESYEAP
ncbi:MAG: hypothetical protein JRH20_01000 [Deltaproteobacteria bacterium]|nr:hypothetical protein [Deltaproteobacteria bacterium]